MFAGQFPEEFRELLGELVDGQLSARGLRRLEEILLTSPELQTSYSGFMMLHSMLLWQAEPAWPAARSRSPAVVVAPLPPIHSSVFSPSLSGVGGWLLSYTVATLLLGIAVLGSWLFHISSHPQIANLPAQASTAITKVERSMAAVGCITDLADCRGKQWSVASDQWLEIPNLKSEIRNHKFFLGDRLVLASGLMEITYDTGAKVILEGPCTYEIESTRGGYLAVGKLTAKVEKGAGTRGRKLGKTLRKLDMQDPRSPGPWPLTPAPLFAVRTPTAIVTDLGTEFGVEVEESGTTRSHVYQGKVELRENSQRTGHGALSILHAGESARVERGRNSRVVIIQEHGQPERFVRRISNQKSEIINHKSLSPEAYAAYVLSLHPVVYYRMERPKAEKDRLVVFDSAPGGHHGEFRSADKSVVPYAKGRIGDALSLRGPGEKKRDYVFVPDYPKTTNNRLTVVAWVMAEARPGDAVIVTNWGLGPGGEKNAGAGISRGQFDFGLKGREGDLSAGVAQRDGRTAWCQEERPLPFDRWQYVAMVVDGTVMRLYRNGCQVASRRCNGILSQSLETGLGIGCISNRWSSGVIFNHDPSAPWVYWQGRIDEVAIFNKALSPETIERLYLGETSNTKGDGLHE